MFPVFDVNTAQGKAGYDAVLKRLKGTTNLSGDAAKAVIEVLADVEHHGDTGVVKYMQKWTDPNFDAARIKVAESELEAAYNTMDSEIKAALQASINHVMAYQKHCCPKDLDTIEIDGAELGMRFTPVDSVGCYVPGGMAVLFSTLIMTAVPAMAAGVPVENISVVSPPPTRIGDEEAGDISPLVLGTCWMLGIKQVYRIGGAQAIAALAYGTESVDKVEMIVGPGNMYVQLAKAMVNGVTGTDNGFYGPSEIVTIADDTARVACVAADLIAQAEHNPGKCFLVAWDQKVIDKIVAEVKAQLSKRKRVEAIDRALETESCAVLVKDLDQAIGYANEIACEHLNLAISNADSVLPRIRHAGEIFIGDQTPVAAGDYYAGPSHTLPTGTTARFSSGISSFTFLKRTGTVCYKNGMSEQTIKNIAMLAEAEGLDGHADSVRVRRG
ncbi:Histidinol dehydrogenase [Poriferisphaera corsica]|uniref:Histidinol dehydrogenase n=1 Tax=Poriferisphaera corsica TaxID=2528020 RepID=A0A517YW93_9BACT|nr:histidinol dehydrogenase [Poriferisphaera corsica]QDU34504.1 Histidinol dehydrogenase [Poriferisphaera corsica]